MPFRSISFWVPTLLAFAVSSAFFAWELGILPGPFPQLPRPPADTAEILFTIVLITLLSIDIGLMLWRRKYGSCPRGTKRATGIAGAIGAFTLLCPACLLLPAGILGGSIILAVITPFLPLLRIVAIILLGAATWMLWPRAHMR